MSVETVLLKRRRALYTSDSSTVICAGMEGNELLAALNYKPCASGETSATCCDMYCHPA